MLHRIWCNVLNILWRPNLHTFYCILSHDLYWAIPHTFALFSREAFFTSDYIDLLVTMGQSNNCSQALWLVDQPFLAAKISRRCKFACIDRFMFALDNWCLTFVAWISLSTSIFYFIHISSWDYFTFILTRVILFSLYLLWWYILLC